MVHRVFYRATYVDCIVSTVIEIKCLSHWWNSSALTFHHLLLSNSITACVIHRDVLRESCRFTVIILTILFNVNCLETVQERANSLLFFSDETRQWVADSG